MSPILPPNPCRGVGSCARLAGRQPRANEFAHATRATPCFRAPPVREIARDAARRLPYNPAPRDAARPDAPHAYRRPAAMLKLEDARKIIAAAQKKAAEI